MTPWLHIVGIGEDGMDGLTPAARAIIEAAEVIIGGDRHHNLTPSTKAERIAWPSPFDALIDQLLALKSRRVVILATGDPLWFSIGARVFRVGPSLGRWRCGSCLLRCYPSCGVSVRARLGRLPG